MNDPTSKFRSDAKERSFSLLETMVAVSLVAVVMVEMTGIQGKSIAFNDFGRKALQATYLAKRIMSQIEYNSTIRSPLKSMEMNDSDKTFDDFPDFTYSVKIQPLPKTLDFMFKVFSGGMLGGDEGDSKSEKDDDGVGAILSQIKPMIEQSIGEDPIWMANVEVSWPEGASRNRTSLSLMLTDTKKLEESLGKLLDAAPLPTEGSAPPPANSGAPNGSTPAASPKPSPTPGAAP